MLSLREAASRPNSTEPLSYSLSRHTRHTADVVLIHRVSDVTHSSDDLSQTIQPAEHNGSADWNHKEDDLGQKLSAWYEMRSSGDSTARV